MISYGTCPQCSSNIERDRISQGLLACQSCGWSDGSRYFKVFKGIERRAIRTMLGLSAFIVASFVLSVNAGSAQSELLGLRVKQILNVDTVEDYKAAIDICHKNANLECLKQAYVQLIKRDAGNLEVLADYGRLLEAFGENQAALPVLSRYFSTGGRDIKTGYSFAKVLEATGHIESAERYYQFVMDSEKNVVQITVLRSYVDMLMKNNRHVDAKKWIEKFKADQQDVMIANQLAEIKKQLAKN